MPARYRRTVAGSRRAHAKRVDADRDGFYECVVADLKTGDDLVRTARATDGKSGRASVEPSAWTFEWDARSNGRLIIVERVAWQWFHASPDEIAARYLWSEIARLYRTMMRFTEGAGFVVDYTI